MTRLVLVDPHTMFRELLSNVLSTTHGMQVVCDVAHVDELEYLELPEFDIGLIDPQFFEDGAVASISALATRRPDAGIIVLTGETTVAQRAHAIEAGAAGILHKSEPVTSIVDAINRVEAGEDLLDSAEVLRMIRTLNVKRREHQDAAARFARLTRREWEILHGLADGLQDREIAERLSIGVQTVRTHMVHIYEKLGVNSRLQALVFAIRNSAIRIPTVQEIDDIDPDGTNSQPPELLL